MTRPLLTAIEEEYRRYRALAEAAMRQLDDGDLARKPIPEGNSVAILVWHLSGNFKSRFTDFLTTDGEKPDRHRDREFEDPSWSRADLEADWEDGWRRVFEALDPLTDDDLQRTVVIRAEPHSVYKAISRQIAHYSGHAYQILFLGKHLKGAAWQTLSVPRGQSEEFNRRMLARQKAGA